MKIKLNYYKPIKAIAICLLLGIILSHYVEKVEKPFLMLVRNMVYFGEWSRTTVEDGKTMSRDVNIKEAYFHPVLHVQAVWPEIYTILSQHVDSDYFKPSKNQFVSQIDTNRIINYANALFEQLDSIIVDSLTLYRFRYDIPVEHYDLPPGWYSGMAQGHAAELFLSAFCLTKDTQYLEWATKSINTLMIPISEGGVCVSLNNGIWLEEYAHPLCEPNLVLNGHIFAIDGLYALTKFSEQEKYKELLTSALQSVNENIYKYEIGKIWSKYDLFLVANMDYHTIHVSQLNALSNLLNKNKLDSQHIIRAKNNFVIGKYVPFGIFVRLFTSPGRMIFLLIFLNTIFCLVFSASIKCLKKRFKTKLPHSMPQI